MAKNNIHRQFFLNIVQIILTDKVQGMNDNERVCAIIEIILGMEAVHSLILSNISITRAISNRKHFN